jgi:hypothetical protein
MSTDTPDATGDFAATETNNSSPYIVVTRTLVGTHTNVLTWTTYSSKEEFDQSRNETMMDGSGMLVSEVYETVAEGVTEDEALTLCSSKRNTELAFALHFKEMEELLRSEESSADEEWQEKFEYDS